MTFSLDHMTQYYPTITKLGLDRILILLERLGSPHLQLPPTIHVAGTNGKGSTIAFLRAIMESANKRVHVYTSPHLIKFNERIILDGQEIDNEYLSNLVERCRAVEPEGITWFELTTASAFLAFSEMPADFLLLETGLGGRRDATNVLKNPALTIITSLSFDHTEYLGNTLKEIAWEKAGILKKGCPLITCHQPADAENMLLNCVQALGCPILNEGKVWKITEKGDDLEFIWQEEQFHFPYPSLAGIHQIQNAGLALAASFYLGLDLSSCQRGLTTVSWPGRLQQLPSPANMEIWLDGAHNPQGAKVILETMLKWKKEDRLPLYLVIGMIDHKDHTTFLKTFQGQTEQIYIIPLGNPYQKLDPSILYEKAKLLHLPVVLSSNVQEALHHIDVHRKNKPIRTLICGSLYLAGEILAMENLSKTEK